MTARIVGVNKMASRMQEIEEEALQLPADQRASLAERLISSLDQEEDPEAERLWIEEAERRYRDYSAGKVVARLAESVLRDVRGRLRSRPDS
ncbi:MAG: addiction module protein [Acidobacteriota bacterium]